MGPSLAVEPTSRLALRVPATRGSVETARSAVLAFIAPRRFDPRTVFDVELVLEEVLMNIATHGDRSGRGSAHDRFVDITVQATPDTVELQLEDDGTAFDPTTAPLRAQPGSLDDAMIGGLGIGLVRKRARKLAYLRRDGRNVLTVEIARP